MFGKEIGKAYYIGMFDLIGRSIGGKNNAASRYYIQRIFPICRYVYCRYILWICLVYSEMKNSSLGGNSNFVISSRPKVF